MDSTVGISQERFQKWKNQLEFSYFLESIDRSDDPTIYLKPKRHIGNVLEKLKEEKELQEEFYNLCGSIDQTHKQIGAGVIQSSVYKDTLVSSDWIRLRLIAEALGYNPGEDISFTAERSDPYNPIFFTVYYKNHKIFTIMHFFFRTIGIFRVIMSEMCRKIGVQYFDDDMDQKVENFFSNLSN